LATLKWKPCSASSISNARAFRSRAADDAEEIRDCSPRPTRRSTHIDRTGRYRMRFATPVSRRYRQRWSRGPALNDEEELQLCSCKQPPRLSRCQPDLARISNARIMRPIERHRRGPSTISGKKDSAADAAGTLLRGVMTLRPHSANTHPWLAHHYTHEANRTCSSAVRRRWCMRPGDRMLEAGWWQSIRLRNLDASGIATSGQLTDANVSITCWSRPAGSGTRGHKNWLGKACCPIECGGSGYLKIGLDRSMEAEAEGLGRPSSWT